MMPLFIKFETMQFIVCFQNRTLNRNNSDASRAIVVALILSSLMNVINGNLNGGLMIDARANLTDLYSFFSSVSFFFLRRAIWHSVLNNDKKFTIKFNSEIFIFIEKNALWFDLLEFCVQSLTKMRKKLQILEWYLPQKRTVRTNYIPISAQSANVCVSLSHW